MDMGNEDKFELEKKTDDSLNYQSPNLTSDWRYGGAGMPNSSMDSVHMGNQIAACKGGDLVGSSPCSSAPLMDSFCPTSWNNPAHTLNLGFSDNTNSTSTSNTFGFRGSPGAFRMGALDVGWNSMLKGGLFIPDTPGLLPHSLSQLPTDSGFIQRAARFSCFSGGNFTDLVSPFNAQESLMPYSRNEVVVQGHDKVLTGNGLKSISSGESQMNELSIADVSKDVAMPDEQRTAEGSPLKDDSRTESFLRSFDEAKQGFGASGDESDEFSGGAGPVDGLVCEPSSGRGSGSEKRKRPSQTTERNQAEEASQQADEVVKDDGENRPKSGPNVIVATNKTTGKNGKQGPQASDAPKEEYIHVRARRGQATNSHSLAERVRREKISERMKFLQDLVPGCSKVTGKAVMLDEIINYVQSLQRQVEFLSMKLATVNPRMDFNVENLLPKDILQTRAGPSSIVGFSPDMRMGFPQLHPSQPGLLQVGLPVMGNSSDVYRQSMNSQLAALGVGFKEPTQLPNAWDEELHNVVHRGFDQTTSQDLDGSQPSSDHMKAEL